MSFWTDEKVQSLRKLNAKGWSFTDIANHVGATRGAVGGKLNRLGLTIGKPKTGGCGARRAAIDRSPAARSTREAGAAALREKFEAIEIVDLPPDQSEVAVSFFRLNAKSCRWPIGDPRNLNAMLFCGEDHHKDYPYCARHCRMAYVPLQQRAIA